MTDLMDFDTRDRESARSGNAVDTDERSPARAPDPEFARSILAGLSAGQKRIESKWLYDARGSHLFDAITDLEDYYPTNAEIDILRRRAPDLAEYAPQGTALVELGSGSSLKTRLLLDALPSLSAYVPIDISAEHLSIAARNLSADYGALDIYPVVGDFTADIDLPAPVSQAPKLLFFPGSTVGNFEIDAAGALLKRLRAIANVSAFVIGVDRVKDEQTLVRAYDDSSGVTAAFNLNLLTRINRELAADFDLDGFRHEARWNSNESRIEMHLVSLRDQTVRLLDKTIAFSRDETIHTENSHKYRPEQFAALARDAGWDTVESWTDDRDLFGVMVLTPIR